jgi:hypothetical protein
MQLVTQKICSADRWIIDHFEAILLQTWKGDRKLLSRLLKLRQYTKGTGSQEKEGTKGKEARGIRRSYIL